MTKTKRNRLTRFRRFRDLSKRKQAEALRGMTADFAVVDDPLAPGAFFGTDPAAWAATIFPRQHSWMTVAPHRRGMRLLGEWPMSPPPEMYPEQAAHVARRFVGMEAEYIALGHGFALTREALDDNLYREMFGRGSRVDYETVARSKERARGLLKSLLTSEQWTEFEASRSVTERIDGCDFKLSPGGMIEARKPRLVGAVSERWCISPDPYADKNDYMPDEDKLIGQLLHLRAGPEQLRAKANIFPGYR